MSCASEYQPIVRKRNLGGNIPEMREKAFPKEALTPLKLQDFLRPDRKANVTIANKTAPNVRRGAW